MEGDELLTVKTLNDMKTKLQKQGKLYCRLRDTCMINSGHSYNKLSSLWLWYLTIGAEFTEWKIFQLSICDLVIFGYCCYMSESSPFFPMWSSINGDFTSLSQESDFYHTFIKWRKNDVYIQVIIFLISNNFWKLQFCSSSLSLLHIPILFVINIILNIILWIEVI